MVEGSRGRNEKEESFKAHRDVFFFTLQRELEKVNLIWSLDDAKENRADDGT